MNYIPYQAKPQSSISRIRLLDLDVTEPVDLHYATASLNNELFYDMLEHLTDIGLVTNIEKITHSLQAEDWDGMKQAAHTLKGSSGYVGASKVHYACYYIQDAYNNRNYSGMVHYYPLLVEAAVEYERYSRELIAGVRKRLYDENENPSNIMLADGYHLVYHERHDKHYCLRKSQELSDRIKVLERHKVKPDIVN